MPDGSASRPRLQTLIFEATQRCNHRCQHCYNVWHNCREGTPYPRGELTTAETLALLDKVLDEIECPHLTLSGGEPLLRSDLLQILDLLHARNMHSTLISNGHLLDEPTIVAFLERGVGLFELPLLSHQRRTHDTLSGCTGAFDAVLAAMAHIRRHYGQFVAVFVATRHNLAHLYTSIKLAVAFGARGVMLNRFNPGGRGSRHIDTLLPSATQLRQALAVADAAAVEFNIPISSSIPVQPCLIDTTEYAHLSFGFCSAGSENAYYTLDPLGNLRPCNHTPTILGNLRETPFSTAIASPKMAAFKAAHPSYCNPCALRDTCQGGCKAAAQVCSGALTDEDPFLQRNRAQASPIKKVPQP